MPIIEIVRRLAIHTFLAIVGSTAIWFLLMALLGRTGEGLLDDVPLLLNPLGWGPGIALGFLVNRKMRDQFACWGWPLSTIWLGYGIWDECRAYRFPAWFPPKGDFVHRAWHMFFTSPNDANVWGGSRFVLLLFTMPALGAVAYSVGAWIALGSKRNPTVTTFSRGRDHPAASSDGKRYKVSAIVGVTSPFHAI